MEKHLDWIRFGSFCFCFWQLRPPENKALLHTAQVRQPVGRILQNITVNNERNQIKTSTVTQDPKSTCAIEIQFNFIFRSVYGFNLSKMLLLSLCLFFFSIQFVSACCHQCVIIFFARRQTEKGITIWCHGSKINWKSSGCYTVDRFYASNSFFVLF